MRRYLEEIWGIISNNNKFEKRDDAVNHDDWKL